MEGALTSRDVAMREIRELVGNDAWLARCALLRALERLDLRGVNDVLDMLLENTSGPRYSDRGLLAKLREERWG
jgi:hypothetical protein